MAPVWHLGSPNLEHQTVQKLVTWRITERLLVETHQNYGIHYSDPQSTPAAEYRAAFGVTYALPIAANDQGVAEFIIPDTSSPGGVQERFI